MFDQIVILATTDTIMTRLLVCAVCCAFGAMYIKAGLYNIRSQTAEGADERPSVGWMMATSDTYFGSKAIQIGRIRVGCGIFVIVFGFVFMLIGPFLASQ